MFMVEPVSDLVKQHTEATSGIVVPENKVIS